ncbi:MAG: hypothetical protein ABW321_08245 [Polyangiales bacterium]
MAYAASSLAAERGWLPVIALAGARDATRAVQTLRAVVQRWAIALEHTETDAATRDFLDRATQSLHDFNLERMYKLLPEQDGRFRRLGVAGELDGKRYYISRRTKPGFEVGPQGVRQRLGDASFVLRAAPVAGQDGDTNYLLQARVGLVLAPIDWGMVVDAAQQLLVLVGSGDDAQNAQPDARFRQKVLAHNPKLGREDVAPVATLWEAFPRLGDVLSSLGGMDDLVAGDVMPAPGVRKVQLVVHLDPKQLEAHYPEIADYLDDLDKLLEADLRWVDTHNRTIALLHLDSRHLTARLELFERDGMLLPSRGGQALADQPLAAGIGTYPYRVLASAHFSALGLRVKARDAQIEFEHERTERGMELRGRMKHVPQVEITGAALGFVPTGLIDVFIPGNIQGLAEKFVTAACRGNGGKGVELAVRFDRRPNGQATLDGAIALEAIDNFLVKLGVGHFNSHVMPDDDVRTELNRLLMDVQRAFSADLEHYALTQRARAVSTQP